MKLIAEIKNVTYPLTPLNKLYYLIGINREFKLFDGLNIVDFPDIKIAEGGFDFIKNQLFFFEDKKIIKIDLDTMKIEFFLEFTSERIWLFNLNYAFKVNESKENTDDYLFSLFSIKDNKILWTNTDDCLLLDISNEYLIFSNIYRTVFCRYDFLTGNKIWSLSFSGNKVMGHVLNIDKVLIFPTKNQDIIGVDIETGKELWRLKNINANSFQIQPKTNYLISLDSNALGSNWYYVINPLTGEILVDKKFLDFYYSAGGSVACITDTHYYFMSNYFGYITERRTETKAHLGCINLATHELEWVEEIGKTKDRYNGYKKPEYRDGKFYLPRSEDGTGVDTLFIYER